MYEMYRVKKIIKVLSLLLILCILLLLYKYYNVEKTYEVVDSFNDIQPPIQNETSGFDIIDVYGVSVRLIYVASYEISGRVVNTHNYIGYNIDNAILIKDVGISWGFLANDVNHEKVIWGNNGNRGLLRTITDGDWLNRVSIYGPIGTFHSNNHLIPYDKRTKQLIGKIKEGDYVKIKGYLVNGDYMTSKGMHYWNTSTVRTDEGESCEVIYVTDVIWLKTKE